MLTQERHGQNGPVTGPLQGGASALVGLLGQDVGILDRWVFAAVMCAALLAVFPAAGFTLLLWWDVSLRLFVRLGGPPYFLGAVGYIAACSLAAALVAWVSVAYRRFVDARELGVLRARAARTVAVQAAVLAGSYLGAQAFGLVPGA